MEFHNIFDCARGESKLRDNSTLACPNFQTKAFGEETRNETTKNRTQHDQGSLNKRSACSMYFWLLHWLLIKGASGELLSDCIPSKRLSKACLEKLLEAVEILEYNSNCSDLNFQIIPVFGLNSRFNKRMIMCRHESYRRSLIMRVLQLNTQNSRRRKTKCSQSKKEFRLYT